MHGYVPISKTTATDGTKVKSYILNTLKASKSYSLLPPPIKASYIYSYVDIYILIR